MANKKIGEIERLPLTDDYIFKRVFAFEGNESVLKDLLEAILRKDIKTVTIKRPMIWFLVKTSGLTKKMYPTK